ncbi:MAG: RNA-binding protein [Pseudomonadota bacterium]
MTRGRRNKVREAPERRCIASGVSGTTARLIRFVLGPDGTAVPDLAEKLPGRGAWLTADRALVEKACRKRLFSRAFRTQTQAPEDLADRLEALLASRLIETLALARKAGQVVTGFEKTRERLTGQRAGALVQAFDGAPEGRAKLRRLAPELPLIAVLGQAELGLAFGRDFAIHAALDKGGFARRALYEADRLAGLRPGATDPGHAERPAPCGAQEDAPHDARHGARHGAPDDDARYGSPHGSPHGGHIDDDQDAGPPRGPEQDNG